MKFIEEALYTAVILIPLGLATSFIVWKASGSKTRFVDFLARHGEVLAYAGLALVVLFLILLL